MSVTLTSLNDSSLDWNISNGTWMAMTKAASAMGREIHPWNGTHDPQTYTAEQLREIAGVIKDLNELVPVLYELADKGAVTLG